MIMESINKTLMQQNTRVKAKAVPEEMVSGTDKMATKTA